MLDPKNPWPNYNNRKPSGIIVDLANFIEYSKKEQMFLQLDLSFPVRAVITNILSFGHYVDYSESFWFELERRFPDVDRINRDILEINLEGFVLSLDEYIRTKVPATIDTGNYIIQEWLDSTTIILKHDESAGLFYDTGSPNQRYTQNLNHSRYPRIF